MGLKPPRTPAIGKRYVPWPKLQPCGRMARRFFCMIDDLHACKKLNEDGGEQSGGFGATEEIGHE